MNKLISFNESEKYFKIKSLVENLPNILVELDDENITYQIDPTNDIRVKLASMGKDGYFSIMITKLEYKKDSYEIINDNISMVIDYLDNSGFDTKIQIKRYNKIIDDISYDEVSKLLNNKVEIGWIKLEFIMRGVRMWLNNVYESLPRENSVKQLERIMKLSSKTDIGNRISDMNKEGANIEYIQNPIDNGIESFEDYEKNKKVKHKTHIKQFNESLSNNLLEFCKYNLAFLLDDGFEIDLYTYNGIEISKDHGFYWDEIKDEFIPFFEMLNEKYDLVKFNRGGEDSVISFDDGGGADHYSYENVINDEIGDDMLLLKISFRAE